MANTENLEQKDVKEFLDKLTSSEIDDLHECLGEVKTKKKKSLWEVFCGALGDDYEGHEEMWNSLSIYDKRDAIAVALSTWTDLMLLGVGNWFANQVTHPPRDKKVEDIKSVEEVVVKDKVDSSFKFTPSQIVPKEATFVGACRYEKKHAVNVLYKFSEDGPIKVDRIPEEAFNLKDFPDAIIHEEDLFKYIKETEI